MSGSINIKPSYHVRSHFLKINCFEEDTVYIQALCFVGKSTVHLLPSLLISFLLSFTLTSLLTVQKQLRSLVLLYLAFLPFEMTSASFFIVIVDLINHDKYDYFTPRKSKRMDRFIGYLKAYI